jgi:hypothetical protein
MERDGRGTKARGVALGYDSLGGQTFDPGKRGGVGETDVVGKEEDEILVIRVGLEELRAFFGIVLEVVVHSWFKIAE